MKELIRRRLPRFFSFARGIKDQLVIEARVFRQVGFRILTDRFVRRRSEWQRKLPVQSPRRIKVSKSEWEGLEDLPGWASTTGCNVAEGAHTVYLPPHTFQKSPWRALALQYPPDAGLKVMKNRGSAEENKYLHGANHSHILRTLTYSHRHLSLVAAALHLQALGPRLYDLLELAHGDELRTAYIVAHCDGRVPKHEECENGVSRLRALEQSGLLKVTVPGGFSHIDFGCPRCAGNCLVDNESGQFQYVDFQNFLLTGYGKFLEDIALKSIPDAHFGDRSLFRGGRYLYQSIPGVRIPAKRRIEVRADVLQSLLAEAGVSVEGRVVLDIGCNLGMMMSQYLAWGARWCHGWDMPQVIHHAQQLLLALGCTRFSLTGTELSGRQRLEDEIPRFIGSGLDGCVVSYLAIRRHIGWLEALSRIPWSFMVYEGHEAESGDVFDSHVEQLRAMVSSRVVARRTYEDGDSTPRDMAILMRGT
jgi:hypothetical protein